jgi:hypothetical protein
LGIWEFLVFIIEFFFDPIDCFFTYVNFHCCVSCVGACTQVSLQHGVAF